MHSASGKFAILVLIGCVKEVFRVHFHCKLDAVVLFFWSLSKIYCLECSFFLLVPKQLSAYLS